MKITFHFRSRRRRLPPGRNNLGGFTLTELLVVLGIIAILVAVLFPMVSLAMRTAQTAKAVSNARQIGMASAAFSTDFGGRITGGQGDGDSTQSDAPLDVNVGPGPMPLWVWYKPEYRLGFYLNEENVISDYTDDVWPNYYDPLNPSNGNFFRNTWAFNGAFNWNAGQLIPRIQLYSDPAGVLYMVSGYNQIGPSMIGAAGVNAGSRIVAGSHSQNGFYFGHNGKAVCLFLDGSVSLLGPTNINNASFITPQ